MAADLDAAIRARLTRRSHNFPGMPEGSRERISDWCDAAGPALLAVLDLHVAPERALPGELHCGELIDWVAGGCPTVRVIAEKPGVEAP